MFYHGTRNASTDSNHPSIMIRLSQTSSNSYCYQWRVSSLSSILVSLTTMVNTSAFQGPQEHGSFPPVDGDCQDLCSYFQLLKHTRFSGLCYVCIISWLALMILSCWFIMCLSAYLYINCLSIESLLLSFYTCGYYANKK
ncbi:hypothetical protein BDA99DRAFT_574621 [Phascolomyces articulosus]|uniref:Uncharacterized protein n=1 Tax=Phascolomyces articulosus TaxID=60185 RepID=A0AAD5PAW4_9FUNG|nr:hypothetical protein BDA99DRAFT_574621 [Phascolomyces articulosus]